MIQEETNQTLKIYLLTGEKISVNTNEIIKRDDAKNSSMPSSFAHTMSAQDIADVTPGLCSFNRKKYNKRSKYRPHYFLGSSTFIKYLNKSLI